MKKLKSFDSESKRFRKIKELLIRDYPIVATPLKHESAFQLLVATVLSAQTLDETVNKVTPLLFKKFPDAFALSNASFEDVDKIISVVNYHKTKSRNIILLSTELVNKFKGIVPYKIDDLIALPGVGRKTANVLISEWFAKPIDRRGNKFDVLIEPPKFSQNIFIDPVNIKKEESIFCKPQGFVVDTHVKRVAKRLGLTKNTNVEKIEKDLMNIFEQNEWPEMSLRLIFHGRYRCRARKNDCLKDPEWKNFCLYFNENVVYKGK